ncbi:Ankyrin-3 [Penicillium capsulatum]|uniref:Ankyrin-3 n=1 Tax=Penicillium capsulatum TaxID=69766 RepID=A0A9W9I244_9EURO|nr:Ankyrin-3 [Penicillium capsulatum]
MAPDTLRLAKSAAKSNNVTLLRQVLDAWEAEENPKPPRDSQRPMSEFQDCLLEALEHSNLDVVEELFKRGNAIWKKNIPLIIWLLQNGADPNDGLEDEMFVSPLATAVSSRENASLEVFELLLKNGAKPNKAAFLEAAKEGHCDMLQILLDRGINVNCRMTRNEHWLAWSSEPEANGTALHYAAIEGKPRVVQFLLERGADSKAKTPDGLTPREAAEKNGHFDCARLLP